MSVNTSLQNAESCAPRTKVRVTLWVVQALLAVVAWGRAAIQARPRLS